MYHMISNSVRGWLLASLGKKLPAPYEFYVTLARASFQLCLKTKPKCHIPKVFQLIVSDWDRLKGMETQKTQDYEDEHGSPKRVQQQVLLPHEIFGTLLLEGERDRLTGGSEAGPNFTVIGGSEVQSQHFTSMPPWVSDN